MAAANRSKAGELIQLAEEIDVRAKQAGAICALATLAERHWDEVPGHTLSNAMWAAQNLLRDVETMSSRIISIAQRPELKEAANG